MAGLGRNCSRTSMTKTVLNLKTVHDSEAAATFVSAKVFLSTDAGILTP